MSFCKSDIQIIGASWYYDTTDSEISVLSHSKKGFHSPNK